MNGMRVPLSHIDEVNTLPKGKSVDFHSIFIFDLRVHSGRYFAFFISL